MKKNSHKIDEFFLVIIFAYTTLLLFIFLVFSPHLLRGINLWAQIIAYGGALLLAIQVIGKKRVDAVDKLLTDNIRHISRTFNDFILEALLIKQNEKGERIESVILYVISLADILLWFITFKYTIPHWFGISTKGFLKIYLKSWWVPLLAMGPICMSLSIILLRRLFHNNKYILFLLKIIFYIVFGVTIILWGWIILPWVLLWGVTWVFLRFLIMLVYLKIKLKLGSVFYVFGVVLLLISLTLFIIGQILNKGV